MEDSKDKKNEQSNGLNNNKKRLISFAKINKYFIYIILCPIIGIISNYFYDKAISSNVVINSYLLYIFYDLSYILGGIPYIILYYRKKKDKINDSYSDRIIFFNKYKSSNKDNKNNSKKKWLIIILICLLQVIPNLLEILFVNTNNIINTYLSILLFIPLFSKLILKQEMYKHQYLSIIISILGIIISYIPKFLEFEQSDLLPNLLYFIDGVCNSLAFVLIKYAFDTFFISPYKLIILFGIIFIPLDSFEFFIYSLVKYHDFSYFNDFLDFSEVEKKEIIIIYMIIWFLFESAYNIMKLIIVFYFSPILFFVTDIIYYLLYWIINISQKEYSIPKVILKTIVFFILILSALIYNEIIILNFCGLNKNTKKCLQERQNQDLSLIEIEDTPIDDEEN